MPRPRSCTPGGSGADGTDTLRNIERLEFADVLPPAAPTTATSVAGDTSAATVSWTAPAGQVTGYTVEVAEETGNVFSLPQVDPTAGNSVVATGLTNGTPYKFRVMATNTAGDGDFSAFSDVVTPEAFVPAPVAPVLTSNLTATLVRVGGSVAMTGTVTPFRGVTVTLSRDLPDGTVRRVASTTIAESATSGSFRLPVPTTASGLSAFHVAVTGPTIVPTTGPTLKLTVFQVKVPKVSPRGSEFVTLLNTGRADTPDRRLEATGQDRQGARPAEVQSARRGERQGLHREGSLHVARPVPQQADRPVARHPRHRPPVRRAWLG